MGLKNLLKVLGITKGRWNRYEGEFDVDRDFAYVEQHMIRNLLDREFGSAWRAEPRKLTEDIVEYRVYCTNLGHYVTKGNADIFRISKAGDKTHVYMSIADQKGNADALVEYYQKAILKMM